MKIKIGKKFKNLIPPETRISLYQTAMNNAGRNFEGKKASVQKMADFASAFYKLAIKEIENIGELNIKQIEKTLGKFPVKKVVKKTSLKHLMEKAKKTNGKKKKKGGFTK